MEQAVNAVNQISSDSNRKMSIAQNRALTSFLKKTFDNGVRINNDQEKTTIVRNIDSLDLAILTNGNVKGYVDYLEKHGHKDMVLKVKELMPKHQVPIPKLFEEEKGFGFSNSNTRQFVNKYTSLDDVREAKKELTSFGINDLSIDEVKAYLFRKQTGTQITAVSVNERSVMKFCGSLSVAMGRGPSNVTVSSKTTKELKLA